MNCSAGARPAAGPPVAGALNRQSRQVRDSTEQSLQLRGDPGGGAQLRVLIHDHHRIEEGVHRRAQLREPAQGGGVLALRGGCGDGVLQRAHRVIEAHLRVLAQVLDVDAGGRSRGRLAQDVGDALVGGGEAGGLGQVEEPAERLQARIEVQRRGGRGQHRIEHLGGHRDAPGAALARSR
jgi:hypothetical protein